MAIPTIDLGGNTLKVNTLEVGVTKPGLAGTALSGTELALLDGVSATSGVVASKAVIANADGAVPVTRVVVADATGPVALTAAQSGALCVFDKTDGAIFTLPAAVAGLTYEFVIAVASSSNAHRVNCTSGDFLLGSIMSHATDDTGLSSAYAANGTTHLAINLDSDAVGRLAGGKFRVTAISGTQWVISGDLLATGTVATPFETS